jgi:hypothetical protein
MLMVVGAPRFGRLLYSGTAIRFLRIFLPAACGGLDLHQSASLLQPVNFAIDRWNWKP